VSLPRDPSGSLRHGPTGHPTGDTEEPTRDGFPVPDRSSLSRQDEKRSLEGILGGMRIVEDAKANPQHHRAMAVSSDRRTKRSSNWLSVNDPAVPAPKSVRKPLAIVANSRFSMRQTTRK
jgi:hypothetical protein